MYNALIDFVIDDRKILEENELYDPEHIFPSKVLNLLVLHAKYSKIRTYCNARTPKTYTSGSCVSVISDLHTQNIDFKELARFLGTFLPAKS